MINDWFHIHLYKNIKDNSNIGKLLREKYDNGEIKDEVEFKEVLEYVLPNSKEFTYKKV